MPIWIFLNTSDVTSFINNILSLSPNQLLFLGGGFVLLALFWYNTGRLFLVGWIVKILWLPINLFAFVLWLFASVTNGIFDMIRAMSFFVWSVRIFLLFGIWCSLYIPEFYIFLIPLLIITFVFFYLTKYGLPEAKIASWIRYSPKAKITPIKKPKQKPLKVELRVEDLPKPEVKSLLKTQGYFETEVEIKNMLDVHLKRLISADRDGRV